MRTALRIAFPALLLTVGLLQVWAQDKTKPAENKKAEAERSEDAPVLNINKGEVSIERKDTASKGTQVAEEVKGLKAELEYLEKALMGSDTSVIARAGGCQVILGEHTNFLVKEVREDVTVVSILEVELELDRGTIIEADFGSLVVDLKAGSVDARAEPGVTTTFKFTTTTGDILSLTLSPGAGFKLVQTPGGGMSFEVTGSVPVQIKNAAGRVIATRQPGERGGASSIRSATVQESGVGAGTKVKGGKGKLAANAPVTLTTDLPPTGTVVGSNAITIGLGN